MIITCAIVILSGPGQEKSPGGDQSLHYTVPGQCGLPDQCLSQQCAPAAGHPGLSAAADGVLHQPHLPGEELTQTHMAPSSQVFVLIVFILQQLLF